MKKNLYLIVLLSVACLFPAAAQNKITGLSEVKLFLDPGHALKENQGLYNYSEAEKTLRVAFAIKEYLLAHTDMQEDNILLCREDDNTQVSLIERTNTANTWGADFYYSIHSDAGSVTANSTLFMYGGWRVSGVVYEKTPAGGKDYGNILAPNLTSVMQLSTRGNMADRTYYDGAETHSNRYPYLHINRESEMPSLLSEAGFHTNPFQQARNLNSQYKRLEAYAAFESLALYLKDKFGGAGNLPAPGIVFGVVKDDETGVMVNDAVITINDGTGEKVYVTDGYESLFKNYSKKPNELHNGFFSFEGLTPGATASITVEADGYEPQTSTVVIPAAAGSTTIEGMGVKDFSMINITAPVVEVDVTGSLDAVAIDKPMVLTFSRKMDKSSVESAIGITPAGTLSYLWINDFTLHVNLSQLDFETAYTLTIDGAIAKNSLTGQFLDGAGAGTEGSDFVLDFTTGEQDITPPSVVSYDPQDTLPLTVETFRPIVRIQFSELLGESSILPNQITVTDSGGETIGGVPKYTAINNIGVLHYFLTEDLKPGETYTVHLTEGIEDMYGNVMEEPLQYSFTAKPRKITPIAVIDDFEGAMGWPADPKANSGTTTGVVTERTTVRLSTLSTASVNSMQSLILNYQWSDDTPNNHTIRFTKSSNTPTFAKSADNTMQLYVFGDASNSRLRLTVREGGLNAIWSCQPITIDWAGWRPVSWNPVTDGGVAWLTGSVIADGTNVNFACFGLHAAVTLAEGLSLTPSYIIFDDMKVVKIGDYYTSIPDITKSEDIKVVSIEKFISVTASQTISDIRIYSITGALVKAVQPEQASCLVPTNNLTPGVYIVKVATGTSQTNVKVIVK